MAADLSVANVRNNPIQPSEASTSDQMKKSSYWSITINNPTEDDFIRWEGLKGERWVKKVMGQLEKGENETPHIQGMLNTDHVRFSQIKKALPRAHIEVARKPAALANYVQKEDTRLAPLPTTRVATQADIQRECLSLALSDYKKNLLKDPETQDEFYNWLCLHNLQYKAWSENLIDASVKKLVREGFYGIEFVMCNPQVRMAFKKYFCEIVIREYGRSSPQVQEDHEASPPQGEGAQNA